MNYLKVDHVWEGSEDGMAEWTDIPNYYLGTKYSRVCMGPG